MIRFLNPAALLLGSTVLVPIILHLFERITAKPQILPTLPLLAKLQIRRKKSSDRIVLLCIRCFILLLLALLFSRPVYVTPVSGRNRNTIIVLDNGPLSAAVRSGQTLLQHGKKAAIECFRRNQKYGRVYFMPLHPFPGEKSGMGMDEIFAVRSTVWRSGLRNLASRIHRITRGKYSGYRLLFLSAGDSRFWNESVHLPMEIEYKKIAVRQIGNTAVTGFSGIPDILFPNRDYDLLIHAYNHKFGFGDSMLTVSVDGVPVIRRTIRLQHGINKMKIRLRFRRAGVKQLMIALKGDAFLPDNFYYREVHVLNRLSVYLDGALRNNPYLRASFRSLAGSAFTTAHSAASAAVIVSVVSDRTPTTVSGKPSLLFAPSRYSGFIPMCRDRRGRTIFTLEPSGITNSVLFNRFMPSGRMAFECSFKQRMIWNIRTSLPSLPLFASAKGEQHGALFREVDLRMAVLPFTAVGEGSGIFYDTAYPMFFSHLISMLIRKKGRYLKKPEIHQIRKAVPVAASAKWYGSAYRFGNSVLPANVGFNPYKYAIHPSDAVITRATGSESISISTATKSAGAHFSFSVLLLLFLFSLKGLELLIVWRNSR